MMLRSGYFFARNFTKTIIPNQCALSHVVRLACAIKQLRELFSPQATKE